MTFLQKRKWDLKINIYVITVVSINQVLVPKSSRVTKSDLTL